MRKNNEVVLAGSGGLDTPVVRQWLQDVGRAPDAGAFARPAAPRMCSAAGESRRR
jgi:hypothetical protein